MKIAGSTFAICVLANFVTAQETGQSLASKASDPTASLMSFQLQNFYTPNRYSSGGSQNIVQFRAAVPFKTGNLNHIARLTLPYVSQNSNGSTGIGDATLFDLIAFDKSWGRIGVGAVALLPTGSSGVSAEKWGAGPAMGFVARPSWGLAGLFNQNIFSFTGDDDRPDVNLSTFQPIMSYSLKSGWSVGTSDMTYVYDWDQSEFTSIPVGMKISKLTPISHVPVQWQFNYEYNFYDSGTGPEETIGLTAKILLPKT
ncbi:hypothetical protein [Roseovarius sp. EL26]|uniref:hypothetical protein n=1 Tax=Roseovarius sp. EL26 TaxID=2126672 RepID=UPI000EA00AEE|nr:hypothetical protein [Roseovarius sp. EL26]